MSILKEELITNHLLLDYFDLWDEFDIRKVDDPKTVRYYELLMNHIQNQIDAGIKWLESDEARDYFYGESQYQTEVFRALEDEWDDILSNKYPSVEALLSEVYRRGKAKGYSDMREHVKFTEQDKLALEFVTNYNFGLIRNIDYDTRSQIKGKITEAVIAGEHPYTVAPKILDVAEERLDGSNFTPKQRATMIARTEVSRVQNTGILQSYVNEGYTEVKILTAEDSNVCDLCLRYAFEFNDDEAIIYENRGEERTHNIIKLIKGGQFPPFHPLCRCTYLSVWESKGKSYKDVVNLTPWDFHDMNKPDSIIRFKKVSKSKIPQGLPGILVQELFHFDDYYGEKYSDGDLLEYGYLANLTHEGISNYLVGEENHINFNEAELLIYEGDELIATHTHLSRVPFNYDDIDTFFENGEKVYMRYLVVHTPEDIFIAEFSENSFINKEKIIQAAKDDYKDMMSRNIKYQSDAFAAEALWDNYLKNEVLNNYIEFRRISK
ncbi:MAG: hypothetical protein IJG19_06645 [Methanobrevibacter sp.]|nr:hypothetical protein [Methanobrevibacter sp.]